MLLKRVNSFSTARDAGQTEVPSRNSIIHRYVLEGKHLIGFHLLRRAIEIDRGPRSPPWNLLSCKESLFDGMIEHARADSRHGKGSMVQPRYEARVRTK